MIARGFRPVVWVFMVGVAVLGCYMLNLRVAAERAELAKLDRQIVLTRQNIRALQTEVGTRSRIPQLEEWNNDVLALAAPATGQYLQRNVSLARFDTRQPQLADQAEVRLASAETGATPGEPAATPAPRRAVAATPPAARPELRRASLEIGADAPKARAGAERPRREADRPVRLAAREERARPVRDERRAGPIRTAAREAPPASTRSASRDDRRAIPARSETRPGPARTAARAAAAPARAASARLLAGERPARTLRKDERPERRRSARD
jgi:hypothetical protein